MKREQKREQTLQLLLDTTKTLISEKGCTQTTLSDIMQQSGLSKGAIFHYVSSKDELFSLVLKAAVDETNNRFFDAVHLGEKEFDAPMQEIAKGISILGDAGDVTNLILMYLISKSDQPAVKEVLNHFYEHSVRTSKKWIATGQQHGIIPPHINADQTAELFVLLSYGLRVRAAMNSESAFGISDFVGFITGILQPGGKDKENSANS
ncbi:TetR/AcrR family transcriptional regulator [Paenibacillus beijingensis]|uniref:TetR family transcriptional regulator n=1 Tax=Paenibacillus beijingensis TaxID=1126833 RepID=A0A0D5NNK2_9BACL|nr:TetR/AcrR family transcriptional regulator [Paenibacillus beijingensis]AJY76720.1 TetR family transcriptional regulator [Paenibacillus beijingensis]